MSADVIGGGIGGGAAVRQAPAAIRRVVPTGGRRAGPVRGGNMGQTILARFSTGG